MNNLLKEIFQEGRRKKVPSITEENGIFLKNFIKLFGIKNILEIGTAHGYSALCMGKEIKKNKGKILTYEISSESIKFAKQNIQKLNMQNTIEIREENILKSSYFKKSTFDLIFIDGHKKQYLEFFQLTKKYLNKNGFFIFDDVLKFKWKMENFINAINNNKDFESITIPIDNDDGIMILKNKTLD